MKSIALTVAAALAAFAAAAADATPQERASKVNEVLRRNLAWFFIHPGYNSENFKTCFLEYLRGKDAELVDYRNRCNCLRAAFIAAVSDLDAPFAACVLLRIRRDVKRFSKGDEEALIEKAISAARFASDEGRNHFQDSLSEEIERVSSPTGYTLARMRTIRIKPFILRPPVTLADAVKRLNKMSPAADLVNEGKGVQLVLKVAGFAEDPPDLPKVQVGEYAYGNAGVTLEEAVKTIAGSVGYTFKVRSDGIVSVFKQEDHKK